MVKATNASSMKEKNKRLILNLIRQNNFSRAEIAKETNLTKAAVTIIMEDLINDGLVLESKAEYTGLGRRPIILKLNPKAMMAVGLNLTRNYAEMGIVNIEGKIICEKKFDVYPKSKAIEEIEENIGKMITENNIADDSIYGIGITAPGLVDIQNTTILNPPNFNEWHYENIGLRLKDISDKNVYLENISGGITLCEKYFGIAKKMKNFLVLIVDDGIGSGIMTSGCLFRKASELGHTSIAFDGIKCECGNFGCVEKYASIPAILKGTNYKSWQEVIDSNDEKVIEKEAEYLSCAIINAANLFSVENVILEGGINYNPHKIINLIEEKLKRNRIVKKTPKVLSGSSYRGSVCAAVSVFDNYFK